MVKRIRFTPDAFEKYLDGLNEKFDTTIAWNTLSRKSEYGLTKSEKGYQKVAVLKASFWARKLGLNEERACFYTKCLGAAFPSFGKEGKKRVEEYAILHDLPYEEKEIMSSVIEESLFQSGRFVVEGLREILLELFDESKDSNSEEIELAKLCHEQVEILKFYDRASKDGYAQHEKPLDDEIERHIDEFGIVELKRRLMQREQSLPPNPIAMTSEEEESYFKYIDMYNDHLGNERLINFILHATNLS